MYFNSALLTTTFLGYIEKENWTEEKKQHQRLISFKYLQCEPSQFISIQSFCTHSRFFTKIQTICTQFDSVWT